MKFKELAVWQRFEFKHSEGGLSYLGFALGPWLKVSTRRYRKDTDPYAMDYSERVEHSFGVNHLNHVGSINVEVTPIL